MRNKKLKILYFHILFFMCFSLICLNINTPEIYAQLPYNSGILSTINLPSAYTLPIGAIGVPLSTSATTSARREEEVTLDTIVKVGDPASETEEKMTLQEFVDYMDAQTMEMVDQGLATVEETTEDGDKVIISTIKMNPEVKNNLELQLTEFETDTDQIRIKEAELELTPVEQLDFESYKEYLINEIQPLFKTETPAPTKPSGSSSRTLPQLGLPSYGFGGYTSQYKLPSMSFQSAGSFGFGGYTPQIPSSSYSLAGGLGFGGYTPQIPSSSYSPAGSFGFGGFTPQIPSSSYSPAGSFGFGGYTPQIPSSSYSPAGGLGFGGYTSQFQIPSASFQTAGIPNNNVLGTTTLTRFRDVNLNAEPVIASAVATESLLAAESLVAAESPVAAKLGYAFNIPQYFICSLPCNKGFVWSKGYNKDFGPKWIVAAGVDILGKFEAKPCRRRTYGHLRAPYWIFNKKKGNIVDITGDLRSSSSPSALIRIKAFGNTLYSSTSKKLNKNYSKCKGKSFCYRYWIVKLCLKPRACLGANLGYKVNKKVISGLVSPFVSANLGASGGVDLWLGGVDVVCDVVLVKDSLPIVTSAVLSNHFCSDSNLLKLSFSIRNVLESLSGLLKLSVWVKAPKSWWKFWDWVKKKIWEKVLLKWSGFKREWYLLNNKTTYKLCKC